MSLSTLTLVSDLAVIDRTPQRDFAVAVRSQGEMAPLFESVAGCWNCNAPRNTLVALVRWTEVTEMHLQGSTRYLEPGDYVEDATEEQEGAVCNDCLCSVVEHALNTARAEDTTVQVDILDY